VDEGWSDAEIRVLMERIAMQRRRAEVKALARRRQPRPLVPKRAISMAVRRQGGLAAKRKRLAG
jgi:hypothetical protein